MLVGGVSISYPHDRPSGHRGVEWEGNRRVGYEMGLAYLWLDLHPHGLAAEICPSPSAKMLRGRVSLSLPHVVDAARGHADRRGPVERCRHPPLASVDRKTWTNTDSISTTVWKSLKQRDPCTPPPSLGAGRAGMPWRWFRGPNKAKEAFKTPLALHLSP